MWDTLWQLIVDAILWLPRVIWDYCLDVILYFMTFLPTEPIPLQDSLNNLSSNFLFYLDIIEFEYGLSVMFTALIARFILRRIPFIG